MGAGVQRLQVTVGGTEVATEIDAAQREVSHAGDGCDLVCGEESASGLDRADQRGLGRPDADPFNVLCGLHLWDPDPGGEIADRREVSGGEVGLHGVDAYPCGSFGQDLGDHRARLLLGVGWDGVLEVEHHGVGAGVEHALQELGVVAGGEQVAAAHQIAPSASSSLRRAGSIPSRSR